MYTTSTRLRFGIDLGGTKTELIALDQTGAERYRKRVATPAHDYARDSAMHCARWSPRPKRALGASASVGVGTPGALSPATGLLRNSNTTCLNGKPFDRDLSRALARPVRIANDANCFALSEASDGAGAGAAVVFGVILGTGTGGGVVVERARARRPERDRRRVGPQPAALARRRRSCAGRSAIAASAAAWRRFSPGAGLVRAYAADRRFGGCRKRSG